MNIRFRAARPDDVEALFDLRCSVRENHMSREQLARIQVTPTTVAEMIRSGDYVTPVVELGGRIVAFAMAQISKGYVFAVFVRPGFEGRGFGKNVLTRAERGLKSAGVDRAHLFTDSNPANRAAGFYRRLGWRLISLGEHGQMRYERPLFQRKRTQFWGRDPDDDSLVTEILEGRKTATVCKADEYALASGEFDDGEMRAGDTIDVFDLRGRYRCAILIADVYPVLFGQIPEKLWRGEACRSAEHFQEVHRQCWPHETLSDDFAMIATHFSRVPATARP